VTAHRDTVVATAAPSAGTGSPAAQQAFLLLRTVFTAAPILFGLDKFIGLLTAREQYLAPQISCTATRRDARAPRHRRRVPTLLVLARPSPRTPPRSGGAVPIAA
jgi:hypothetical protein